MKISTLALSVCFVLVSTFAVRAELTTPFNYTTSFDGGNALLYKTFNKLFDLTGNDALTGNQQLYETYAVSPGTIMAEQAKVYGLTGTYSEKSKFTIFGNTDTAGDILYTSNSFPAVTNIKEFYNSTPLFDNDGYSGDLNFKISNSNGTFYSNAEAFANINLQNGTNGKNADANINHFIYFDVSDLIASVYGDMLDFDFTSAYLVGYEDRAYIQSGQVNRNWDGDYNDGLFLVFTNAGGNNAATPEPATCLIFGIGLMGLPLVRRFRKM